MSDQKVINVSRSVASVTRCAAGTIRANETLEERVNRLASMKGKSFAFRLSAILASDNRPGYHWATFVK